MYINELYKRRIRIIGKMDAPHGHMLHVYDLETGEQILNVARVIVYLDPREVNRAEVTYYEHDAQGRFIRRDGESVMKTVILPDTEIDLPAFERYNPPVYTDGV